MATPHVRKLTMAAPVVKQEPEVPSGFGLLAASSSSFPNMTEASIEELTDFQAMRFSLFTDCMTIVLADDIESQLQSACYTDKDNVLLNQLEQLPGRYWKISECVEGKPCFKREGTVTDPHDGDQEAALYLWHCQDQQGWVITSKPREATDLTMWAWLKCVDGDMLPNRVHWPFYARKNAQTYVRVFDNMDDWMKRLYSSPAHHLPVIGS